MPKKQEEKKDLHELTKEKILNMIIDETNKSPENIESLTRSFLNFVTAENLNSENFLHWEQFTSHLEEKRNKQNSTSLKDMLTN